MIAIVSPVAESSQKNEDSLTAGNVPVNENPKVDSSKSGNVASSSTRPKRFFLLKKLLGGFGHGGFGGHRGGYGGHYGGYGGYGGYVYIF